MDNNTLNGFEVFNSLNPNVGNQSNLSEVEPTVIEDAVEDMTDEELDALRGKDVPTEGSDEDIEDEDIEDDEPKTKTKDKSVKKLDTIKPTATVVAEENDDVDSDTNAVTTFFGALSEKMGWEIGEEDVVPQTAEELITYFQEAIEEQSVPEYANDEVAKLDEFVRNGGNIRDYFTIDAEIDLDTVELEDNDNVQKTILKEYMKEKGLKSAQIEKKLSKYEDAGILLEEAEDALEILKEIREEKKEALLVEQKKEALALKESQQVFFNNVVGEIKGLDNIRGIDIPKKDKELLMDYIFRPDADGKTKYLKEYSKSVRNLIESAYFTMKGDTLLDTAKKEGKKKAIDGFKNALKNNSGISKRSQADIKNSNDDTSIWSSLTRQLRVA